jgi:hypothetical protein
MKKEQQEKTVETPVSCQNNIAESYNRSFSEDEFMLVSKSIEFIRILHGAKGLPHFFPEKKGRVKHNYRNPDRLNICLSKEEIMHQFSLNWPGEPVTMAEIEAFIKCSFGLVWEICEFKDEPAYYYLRI